MHDTEFDYYADEERPVWVSERRLRFRRYAKIVGKSSGILGFSLIAATYLDSAFVYHQYYFFLTEQASLAIAGAIALVFAGNACLWSRSGPGSVLSVVLKVFVLVATSPIVTFILVFAIFMTAGQLGHQQAGPPSAPQ